MTEFTLGYREVITDQDLFEKWTEITLTTGGTQSTLKDIKATEKASGYSYKNSSVYYTRNRFIYWRINFDYLELIEHSLDINLTGSKLRYRFTDTPIIDGITVQETDENVIVLVPTLCSVHKLIFPHPAIYHQQDDLLGINPNITAPSIFSKASSSPNATKNSKNFYVFNSPSAVLDQLPNLASSYYDTTRGEAIFVLAYPSSELLLIKLTDRGESECIELKSESFVPRFLSGITDKFRSKQDGNQILTVLVESIDDEVFGMTLAKDGLLKFWSIESGSCVAAIDIFAEIGHTHSSNKLQAALLKKSCDTLDSNERFAIFVSFSNECKFHVIEPIIRPNSQIKINRLKTVTPIENDLIDFSLQSNRIWTAWRTKNEDCVIYIASLRDGVWIPVIKQVIDDVQDPGLMIESDPRQAYLQNLFYPGRFPLYIINKSLGIYRKSNMMGLEIQLTSVASLKQAICLAIENEIQSRFTSDEVTDEKYLEYAGWCWRKFYSCCIQYHQSSLRPLGLMLLPRSSGAILLKKGTISFLRPMEPLEHLALCGDSTYKNQFRNFALLTQDGVLLDDVMALFDILTYLEQQITDGFKVTFESQVEITLKPDVVINELLEGLITEVECGYTNIVDYICTQLNRISDLYKTIHKILELLRTDSTSADPDNVGSSNALHFFGSNLGVAFVSACLRQQCQNRFDICRNLLILCKILATIETLSSSKMESIHSVCLPEIIYLTQANFVMLWLANLPALNNIPQDSTLQRLSPLKLTPAFNLRMKSPTFSLMDLFISSTGGQEARKALSKVTFKGETMAHWHLCLLPFVGNLRQIIWPLKNGTLLVEWLVSSGQHVWLQQYVKLLRTWCDWNISSSSFLLAASFLTSGEHYKALDLFEVSAKGVLSEPFLQRLIKNQKGPEAYVAYYLKVIHLFELHKARDCAIQIANTALSIVESDSPLLATLYSIIFKHHLALKHYVEAFYALRSNPDLERKRDSLRDLVKTLLDDKSFDVLLGFTYGDMEELFTDILLARARATDPMENVYYDFLYAYQIKRGPLCYRLAASVMYEQAFRLAQYETVEALEKRVKCCLVAKNMLHLTDPQYAWIVRPSDPDEEEIEITVEPLAGSGRENDLYRLKRQVEVVNIDTVKKELVFLSARLRLARFNSSSISNVMNVEELVMFLNETGLFKTALEVCKTFDLPSDSVFETLTWKCAVLSEEEDPDVWNWLVENDLQDLISNRDSAQTVVWELLQSFLNKYEEPNSTVLHKVVCKKIISLQMYIPFWLLISYKARNPTELLRLLHSSGWIEEAFDLAREYLLAAMGYGKDQYGFKVALSASSPAFCLPVYEIQCLITELKMQNEVDFSKPFETEYDILKGLFEKYLSVALRVSNEKCQLQMTSFGTIPGTSFGATVH